MRIIGRAKIERVRYKYDSPKERDQHKSLMAFAGWNIIGEAICAGGDIISYSRTVNSGDDEESEEAE